MVATIDLTSACLHAVTGSSWRLRDDLLAEVLQHWDGPVHRHAEPDDLDAVILSLSTASLFEPSAVVLLRASKAYLNRHKERFMALVEAPVQGGVMVLVTEPFAADQALGKALAKAGRVYRATTPDPRSLRSWLQQRLSAAPVHVERSDEVAAAMIRHCGDDVDALLGLLERAVDLVEPDAVRPDDIRALVGDPVERPAWEFTDAALSGKRAQAMQILHDGRGLDPHHVLAGLANELRRCLAVLASDDDAEARRLSGGGTKPSYHTRRRAAELGQQACCRLLAGVIQAQRALRRSGVDQLLVIEALVANIQRVIRLRR